MLTATEVPVDYSNAPLVDLSIRLENEARMKEFRDLFCREAQGPYIIQWPDRDWKYRRKPVSDPLIKAHLSGKYWVGVPGGWYSAFAVIDFDHPTQAHIETTIQRLDLSRGQYLLFTSPSWWETKNQHLYIPIEYKGRPVTRRLALEALHGVLGDRQEIYPQEKKAFRLPLGRNQFVIGADGFPQGWLDWQAGLDQLLSLEPFGLETLPYNPPLPFNEREIDRAATFQFESERECAELWKHGLESRGTRHESLKRLTRWLYRQNYSPETAVELLFDWQLKKSNGFSDLVQSGDRRALLAETERVVKWFYEKAPIWPDSIHNLQSAVCESDLRQGVELFPGDVVNQKRWFNLVSYCRPRRRYAKIFTPRDVWRDGTDWRNVQKFRTTLEEKGVATIDHEYLHVQDNPDASYPKSVTLKLAKYHDVPIQSNNRNINEFYAAVRHVCPKVSDAVDFTGIAKQRFYDAEKRKTTDNSFKIN